MNESKRKVQWSVDASHAEFIEQLEGNFREVVDPEIGLNILELGLVRDVIIEQTGAHIIMMMTTPF